MISNESLFAIYILRCSSSSCPCVSSNGNNYRIIRSDGPPSNFNRIFVLIKVCPKLKPLHTFVVPTLIKGCCQNFRLIRVFCYITFWLEVGVCSEIGVFTPMDPPSESLIKKSSDQKMLLIFSLSIAN